MNVSTLIPFPAIRLTGMEVQQQPSDVRDAHGMKTGVLCGKRVYLHDFAWALKCMLGNNVTSKPHAGCLFYDDGEVIHVSIDDDGMTFTREQAQEFIREWL